jgi:hypothetical protein
MGWLPRLASVVFLASRLAGQASVAGPVEGFTFDPPTRSIRAVLGSLGSATLGPGLVRDLDFASAAPQRSHAIACRSGRCFLVSGLGTETQDETNVLTLEGLPEGAAWFDRGAAAAVYSRTGNWVQILRGLPASVNADAAISGQTLGGTLLAVAGEFTGRRIAMGIGGDRPGIYEISENGNLVPLAHGISAVALAYAGDGQALLAIDGKTRQLAELDRASLALRTSPLAGLDDPVAVQAGRDQANRPVVFVAGRSDRLLMVADRARPETQVAIPLGFEPDQMEPLGVASYTLRARAEDGDPLWSFVAGAQPRVYFVPAGAWRDVDPSRRRRAKP